MGSLVVSLSLQYAEYTKGLDKAGQEALSFAQKNQRAMDQATAATDRFFTQMTRNAVGLVAAYVGINEVIGRVTGAFEKLGKLSDMAQQTGASVENLSRILKVAAATKFDTSEVENGLIKLSKGMATVDSETNKVHKALSALGISATDSAGKMRDPAQVYIDAANKLAQYNDSANKAALATDLFGKTGAKQLPFLNDLVEHIGKVSATSADAARKAEALSEKFGLMRVKVDDLFTSFATDLMPTMDRIGGAFSESTKGATAFGSAAKVVSVVMETLVVLGSEVWFVFKAMGTEIGGVAAQMVALAKLDFAGFKAIGKAMKEDAIAARIEHDKFIAAVINGDKKVQELKLRPKEDGKDLNYRSGHETKEKISDYQRLKAEIEGMTAASKLQLSTGIALTSAEKLLTSIIADRANGTKKLTKTQFEELEGDLKKLDALEKLVIAHTKLKKAKEEVAQIVTSATAANAEHIANLELENSLVGKSALQQALLRSEYQANLALKRQFADIDKATKGLTDPAAIAKLQAESSARIQFIKDEAKAKIQARFDGDAQSVFAVTKDKAITQAMGQMLMPDEVAKRTAMAQAEHAAALSKIADLDVIRGRIEIEAKLKTDIAASDAIYDDKERQQQVGRAAREIETEEKIRLFREENAKRSVDGEFGERKKDEEDYIRSVTNLLNDKYLNEQRGFEMTRGNAELSRQMLTAEADAKKNSLGMSKNQLEFDNANLKLQQQLFEIQQFSGDADEQKKLGLSYQIEKQERLLVLLTQKKNLDLSQVGSGEEFIKINKELLDLKEKMAGLDVAAADKAKLKADSAARQLEEAKILADTAQKTINANFVQQFESDFHGSMLRLLEQGKTNWSAMMKGFANSFKVNVVDYIYKQFAKPFVFKAIMSLAGVVGANGLAAAAGTEADAGLMGKVSTMEWMTIGKSIYDGMSTGFASFSTEVSNWAHIAGASGNASRAIGAASSYIGAGLAGVTIGTFIAGDKTVLGLNGMTTSTIGAALGAAFGGPIGAFFGGIAGGLVSALFGMGPKKYEQSTVRGGFSGAGFAGGTNTHWTQKGGLFRSNRSGDEFNALADPAQQFLNSMVGKSGVAFARLITVSGDAARSVDGWNFAIDRALVTEEDMTKLFGEMADSMGTYVLPELEKFRAKGENLADTAVRLTDEYIITDSIFKMMGFTAAETGIASLGMRDSLIQAMGGIQKTSATMDAYYKNYFTAEEQQANSLRRVTDQFKILGVEVPKTRAEFRKMADVLVKDTTPAGQKLFAAFMELNPAFAAVTQSTEELAAAAVDMAKQLAEAAIIAMNSIGSALDSLRGNNAASLFQAEIAQDTAMSDVIAAMPWITSMDQLSTITMADANNYSLANKKLIATALGANVTLKNLTKNIQTAADQIKTDAIAKAKQAVIDSFATLQRAVTSERDSITKNFTSAVTTVNATITKLTSLSAALRQSVAAIRAPSRAEAQAQILTALTIAKAGGGLPSTESLAGALQAISEPSESLFKTFVDYQYDQKLTGNRIADLADLSDGQLSMAEKTLATLTSTQEFQMSRLDGILSSAQNQLDVMNVVNTSVLTVSSAVYAMTDAINAYMKLAPGAGMSGVGLPSASTPSTNGLSARQIGMGMTVQDGSLTFAGSTSAATSSLPTLAGMQSEVARRQALRGFATGTDYVPQDMTARIHEGEAIIPKAYNRNNQSTNAELVSVVRELIATVKAGDIAIAQNTAESAKFARRADGFGMLVRAETDTPLPVRQTA